MSGFHLWPVDPEWASPTSTGLPRPQRDSRRAAWGGGGSANWDQTRLALQRLWGRPAPAGEKPGLPERPVNQAAGTAGPRLPAGEQGEQLPAGLTLRGPGWHRTPPLAALFSFLQTGLGAAPCEQVCWCRFSNSSIISIVIIIIIILLSRAAPPAHGGSQARSQRERVFRCEAVAHGPDHSVV